jgi:hypothetical protein
LPLKSDEVEPDSSMILLFCAAIFCTAKPIGDRSLRVSPRRRHEAMSAFPEPAPSPAVDLEVAAAQAIAACGGDAREAVKALLVAVDFLEAQVDDLQAAVSTGYARRRYDVEHDHKE